MLSFLTLGSVTLLGKKAVAKEINDRVGRNSLPYTKNKNYLPAKTRLRNYFYGDAGNNDATGAANVGVGGNVLSSLTTGESNVGIGETVLTFNSSGAQNVAIGREAMMFSLDCVGCTAIGYQALTSANTGVGGTAIGRFSLSKAESGFHNTGIGDSTLRFLANGSGNAAIGASAGSGLKGNASMNTALGFSAAGAQPAQKADARNSISIGAHAYNTDDNQISFSDSVNEMRFGGAIFLTHIKSSRSIFIGEMAGSRDHSAGYGANIGIGAQALSSITTADGVIAIGDEAGSATIDSVNCVFIGRKSGRLAASLIDCVAVGAYTLENAKDGVGDTAIGYRALQYTNISYNNTAIGDSALWIYQGRSSVAVGYRVAEHLEGGDNQVIIGCNAANGRKSGGDNVFIGTHANALLNVVVKRDEFKGTANGAIAAGSANVGIGARVLLNCQSPGNVAVGWGAGASIVGAVNSEGNNVFIGHASGWHPDQLISADNSIAIGSGTFTRNSNEIVIGNGAHTKIILPSLAKIELRSGQIQFPNEQQNSDDPYTLDGYKEHFEEITLTADGNFPRCSASFDCTVIGNRIMWNVSIKILENGQAVGKSKIPIPYRSVSMSAAAACLSTGQPVPLVALVQDKFVKMTISSLVNFKKGEEILLSGNYRFATDANTIN